MSPLRSAAATLVIVPPCNERLRSLSNADVQNAVVLSKNERCERGYSPFFPLTVYTQRRHAGSTEGRPVSAGSDYSSDVLLSGDSWEKI